MFNFFLYTEYIDAQEFKNLGAEISSLTSAVRSLESTLRHVVHPSLEQNDGSRRASLTVAPPLAALTRTLNRTSTQFKFHEEQQSEVKVSLEKTITQVRRGNQRLVAISKDVAFTFLKYWSFWICDEFIRATCLLNHLRDICDL